LWGRGLRLEDSVQIVQRNSLTCPVS
jgi:hypothetical protein